MGGHAVVSSVKRRTMSEAIWGYSEAIWGYSEAIWGYSGAIWAILGVICGHFGAIWAKAPGASGQLHAGHPGNCTRVIRAIAPGPFGHRRYRFQK